MDKPTVKATVVLLVDGLGRICLARKKQAIHHPGLEIKYSLGTWNGYGGKIEPEDATIEDTALRELHDETKPEEVNGVKTYGVVCGKLDLELVCRAYFYSKNKITGEYDPAMDVSFFMTRRFFGKPHETKEMGPPQFFDREFIPYDEMMPADKFLFKEFLSGKRKVYQVLLRGKNEDPIITELDEKL